MTQMKPQTTNTHRPSMLSPTSESVPTALESFPAMAGCYDDGRPPHSTALVHGQVSTAKTTACETDF